MKQANDTELWNQLKQSVQPLAFNAAEQDLPPRLKVRRAPLSPVSYNLDLHHLTIQEAYQKTQQFIEKHYKIGTKHIQIITGKGREGKGAIHGEFAGWLDTTPFKQYIRQWEWKNDGGAANLWLRKKK